MRYITADDVDDLVVGAGVLGSGGGGDWYAPRQMLIAAIERHGPVPLVDPADLDPAARLLPIISGGAPPVLIEMIPGTRESALLRATVEDALHERCSAVLPLQMGPVNAVIPVVVAAQLGLPCVDADAMLRCFPMVEMTLFTLAGLSPSPLVVVDAMGAAAVLSAPDNNTVSAMLRSCLPHMGLVALGSAYRITAGECARIAPRGGVSRCLRIGRTFREAQSDPDGVGDEQLRDCLDAIGGVLLFTGFVAELFQRTTDGFPRGVLSIESSEDPSSVLRVDFQNENLVVARDGIVLATVPDLIVLLDLDTGTVMQTVDVVVGQRLHVIGAPVGDRWHTGAGTALVGPRAFGYDIDPVRVGA
ncbi:DUF917 domain-containing protein [Pseudonocardia spinosispora]|uniref:DUF917 domain-containing protein n=1 Tax=Pseudonocardia spinosispora TaxID=103441 RepID=UPI0004147427|nr:DUF917 domain-containing protein [Pseudonocardia spinosispora]